MFFESRSCCYLIQNVPWCQNHRRKTLMMWLQNCMKWDISWSINISLRCAPLAQHFSHFSCLVIALFLIFSCEKSSKRENEKYVDDAPFPLLLCTCKLVSYATESNSVFTEFKMKKFFLLFGIAREERVANNKKKCWTDFNMNMHIEVDQTLTNCIGDKIIHSSWILLSFFGFYKIF